MTWRTEEGGVSWLERRGYGGLGFRMAKRGRWEVLPLEHCIGFPEEERMMRFRWSGLRRRYGDGAAAIDETIVGAAPWRWRTGRLNRRDGEMDDRSSSGEVDEGRRAVAVDDVVGEKAPTG